MGKRPFGSYQSYVYPPDSEPKVPLRDPLLKFIAQADELKAREAQGLVVDED